MAWLGAANALGVSAMLRDIGVAVQISLCTDCSAAKGIASRRGLGKIRHIELCEVWLQSQVAQGRLAVRKVPGADHFADSFTKHSSAERITQTMRCTNRKHRSGRHEILPDVAM